MTDALRRSAAEHMLMAMYRKRVELFRNNPVLEQGFVIYMSGFIEDMEQATGLSSSTLSVLRDAAEHIVIAEEKSR